MRGMTIIVKSITQLMVPAIFLLGVYVIFHGHLTPGGGFAGGVLIAGCHPPTYFTASRLRLTGKSAPSRTKLVLAQSAKSCCATESGSHSLTSTKPASVSLSER